MRGEAMLRGSPLPIAYAMVTDDLPMNPAQARRLVLCSMLAGAVAVAIPMMVPWNLAHRRELETLNQQYA